MIDEQMHRICDVDGYHYFNIRIAAEKDGQDPVQQTVFTEKICR